MNSNSLLDSVKKQLKLPSDYALSKTLGVSQQSLQEMRKRGLSDERALQVAELLDLNPGEVLVAIHAERSKDEAVRQAWERVSKTLKTGVGAAAFFVLGLLGGYTPPSQAAQTDGNPVKSPSLYIM